MTHPFITAVQLALDTYGLPDDVDILVLSPPSLQRETVYCSISLKSGLTHSGKGATLAVAYANALDAKAGDERRKDDVAARQAARDALAAAGHDPNLIPA